MGPRLQDFKVLSTVGKGSHGTVRKVKRLSDEEILVWKELNYGLMTETEKQGLVMEVNLLRELNHPHIVRFLHHIVDRRTTTLYILMEYCPGGDLRQLVNKCKKTGSFLPEDFIWKVLKQICEALKTCHTFRRTTTTTTTTARSKVILHRDIKPANVFLGPAGEVKLGDFGLARTLTSDLSFATSVVGTPYYMSPEVVEGQEYNDKSDMWSLGCLIYELCALQPPFMAATHAHLAAKIKEARYPPIPLHYTLELRELLDELLTPQYFMRPSALMLLHHPSLTSRFPPLSHAFSLSLSHAGGREEVEKEEAVRGMIQGDGETEIGGRERREEEEEEDKKRKVEDGERSNKQENSPNFPSLPDTPHTCPSNTDTTPAPTHLSATYHIPTTPLDAPGGAGGGCLCKGVTETAWREYLVSMREKEVLMKEREIAVREREREVSERERKVVGMEREVTARERRVVAMEKEAREHLIRAQIFLKSVRGRKVNKDAKVTDGPKFSVDREAEAKFERKLTCRRDMSGRREVKGCQGFERQDSNSRAKKEPDFQSKQEQDSHARMDPRIHSKIQDFRSIRDYKTQPKTHQDLNDVNQNEKTPKFDLTSDLDPPMTPQLHPRPDCDSDLDTTLSAGLDETEEVTTARPDPAVLRNPFLEMRSGHGKQVTFSGVENGCVFKNNTLDNPKSRKKMGCVFVLDSGQVMQDVKDARSKVRSVCEVRGTECEEVAEIRLKRSDSNSDATENGEQIPEARPKRSDLNSKATENGDKLPETKSKRVVSNSKATENGEKLPEFKLRRSLSELKGTVNKIELKRSASNPKPAGISEDIMKNKLNENTNTRKEESQLKNSNSKITVKKTDILKENTNITQDSRSRRSYLGAMRDLLRDKENQGQSHAVPNLKKPLVTQKPKGTVLQFYNVV